MRHDDRIPQACVQPGNTVYIRKVVSYIYCLESKSFLDNNKQQTTVKMSTHTWSMSDLLEAKADLLMAQSDLTCVEVEYNGADLAAERVRRTIKVSKAQRHLVTVKHQRRRYEERKHRRMRRYREAQVQAKRAAKYLLAMREKVQREEVHFRGAWMDDTATFNQIVPMWQAVQQERTATPAGGTDKAVPGFEVHEPEFHECTEKLQESEGSDDTADTEKYDSEAFKALPIGLQGMLQESNRDERFLGQRAHEGEV